MQQHKVNRIMSTKEQFKLLRGQKRVQRSKGKSPKAILILVIVFASYDGT